MKPEHRFLKQPKSFWAHVRTVSEKCGYTIPGKGTIKVPSLAEIATIFERLNLRSDHLAQESGKATVFGQLLSDYFQHRADLLNRTVEPLLMDAHDAKALFERLVKKYKPQPDDIPWNKQTGKKKAPAYLTAIVNMIIRANIKDQNCDFDPRALTTVTKDGRPLRTLARRVDGAFPSAVNPVAVWEIKEYYYTTTFGSRVADGVYETLLDGVELEELRENEGIDVKHYLMVDSHYTWWTCGRSYLCRIVDMLHMGLVDEVLFGLEVVDRLPVLVEEWLEKSKLRC